MSRSRRALFPHAVKLIGLGLLVWVLRAVDFGSLRRAVLAADYGLLAVFAAGCVTCFVLRGVRYHFFLRTQDIVLPLRQSMALFIRSTFWSMVVPGRLGELTRAAYLARLGVSLERAGANVIIERLADLLVICLACLGGALLLWREALGYLAFICLAAGLPLAGGYLFVRWKRSRLPLFLEKILRVSPKVLLREIFLYRHKTFLLSTTVFLWLFYAAQYELAARAFHIPIGWQDVLFCFFMSNLVTMVPVTFAGIGTRDSLMVYLFARLGVAADKAVLFSMSFLLAYVLLVVVCSLAVATPLGRLEQASPGNNAVHRPATPPA